MAWYHNFIPFKRSFFMWKMSDDKQIAVEIVGHWFGWSWKSWRWRTCTGRIFKLLRERTSEELGNFEEIKPLAGNIIVFDSETFQAYEFEPYMEITKKLTEDIEREETESGEDPV